MICHLHNIFGTFIYIHKANAAVHVQFDFCELIFVYKSNRKLNNVIIINNARYCAQGVCGFNYHLDICISLL